MQGGIVMVFATSTGYKISNQIACELKELYLQSRGEHVAGRLWRQVLSEEDRVYLGGDFRQVFVAEQHRMLGIYNRIYPRLSLERAMLEVLRQVGWLTEARYERLIEAIGEDPDLPPSRGSRPVWDKETATLFLNGQAIRRVRQPKKAFRIVAILNAFESRGGPNHLKHDKLGLGSGRELSDAVGTLNLGLEVLVFERDGRGEGVRWSRQ
jgi:hypothetical protein